MTEKSNQHFSVPLFFTEFDHFKQLIPQQEITLPQGTELPFYPLLDSYLSHYKIDFVQQALASHYAIWQSTMGVYKIMQQRWQVDSAKGNLIIVHGYLDHSGLYGQLIQWGLKQQLNVYCFDLPGHGLSSGQRAAINSFTEYTQVLDQVISSIPSADLNTPDKEDDLNHSRTLIIGQSTGCAIISDYLLSKPNTLFKHVFLLAPLVRSYQWKRLRQLYFLCKPFLPSIKRNFTTSSHDKDFNFFIEHNDPLQVKRISLNWLGAMEAWYQKIDALIKTLKESPEHSRHLQSQQHSPTTIIQGTGDKTVDWHYNIPALKECLPRAQCKYIKNAKHHLVKESEEFWQQVEHIIDNQYTDD